MHFPSKITTWWSTHHGGSIITGFFSAIIDPSSCIPITSRNNVQLLPAAIYTMQHWKCIEHYVFQQIHYFSIAFAIWTLEQWFRKSVLGSAGKNWSTDTKPWKNSYLCNNFGYNDGCVHRAFSNAYGTPIDTYHIINTCPFVLVNTDVSLQHNVYTITHKIQYATFSMYHIQRVGGIKDRILHGAICRPLFSCRCSVICTHIPWSNTSVRGLRIIQ